MKWSLILLISGIVTVAILIGVYFIINRNKNKNGGGPLLAPTIWLSNIYKDLNWSGAPSDDAGGKVTDAWISWAKSAPNSILQYYVNYRRTIQKQLVEWPSKDEDIILNPVYTWDGLVTAVYIWNKIIDLNIKKGTPLGNVTGFCNEDDNIKRQMTLAAFLGNATVESAYFLVCKESTILAVNDSSGKPDICPGTGSNFNPRYYDNCDQGNPLTYSCQGGPTSGGGSGGTCNPTSFDKDSVCSTQGCAPQDPKNTSAHTCVVTSATKPGGMWQVWDDSIVKSSDDCDKELITQPTYTHAFWCPYMAPAPAPPGPPPAPPTPFNPVKDKCTGGWPVCQFPGPDGKFINMNPTDPCMSDPHADGTYTDSLDNNKSRCTDWNGNPWPEAQECYFGRGLIQLTWSCNYYQAQRMLRIMADLIDVTETDSILKTFQTSIHKPFDDPMSINLCANPDNLCGSYKTLPSGKVEYNENIINQCIPWLSCIIYWATKCAPAFNKCYAFSAAYQGIAPSGAGNPSIRLNAMKLIMKIMGSDITNSDLFTSSDTDFALKQCSSGPPSPSPSPPSAAAIWKCAPSGKYPDDFQSCKNLDNYKGCTSTYQCDDPGHTCYQATCL